MGNQPGSNLVNSPMKILSWVRGLLHPPPPEEQTRVVVDEEGIRCLRPDGSTHMVAWSDLQLVGVETNEAGPFIEDVYYYLEGTEYGFYIPQCAQGEKELVDRLLALPGFDCDAFSAAMCSTAAARFVCWQKEKGKLKPGAAAK